MNKLKPWIKLKLSILEKIEQEKDTENLKEVLKYVNEKIEEVFIDIAKNPNRTHISNPSLKQCN